MRRAKERVLKDPEQIKILEEYGFKFERCGYALCMLPEDKEPRVRRIDIYRMEGNHQLPDLRLYITHFEEDFFVVINAKQPQTAHYFFESRVSKIQRDFLEDYLKEYGYPYDTQK